MNATLEIHAGHPIVRNITLMYGMSIVIAILVAVASLAGLTYRSIVYPTDGLQRDLVPTDVVNLCLGLPILLGSMWLARRGRLIGLLCWPGAIFFILYTYLIYVFAMPLNAALLLHLSLVALSLYTLMSLVASIDGNAIQVILTGRILDVWIRKHFRNEKRRINYEPQNESQKDFSWPGDPAACPGFGLSRHPTVPPALGSDC